METSKIDIKNQFSGKKIALFGATGRTGIQFLKLALENGFHVQCLVRSPKKISKIEHPNLQYLAGKLESATDIEAVIRNCNVVVSVLGHSKGSPPYFQTNAIKKIVACMKRLGVQRLIVLTGAGVTLPGEKMSAGNQLLSFIIKTLAPKRFDDGIQQCNHILNSGLNYTIVRVPVLTNQPKIQNYSYGNRQPGLFSHISRMSVAHFILQCIEIERYNNSAPIVF